MPNFRMNLLSPSSW